MSTDSGGGAPQKKLTTAEILAKARAEKAAAAAASATAVPAAPVEPAAAPPAPAAAPKSTAEILAAARAAKAAAAPAVVPSTADAPARPKSTADILAAARAAKAGAPVSAPPAATPLAAAAIAPATKSASTGPKPSVAEMLAAVRGGQPAAAATTTVAPTATAKVPAPPMPAKPQPPAAKKNLIGETRRGFISAGLAAALSPFWIAWASFAAANAAFLLACLRFMLPNVLTEPPSKFKVGPPADFDLGTVSEKFKAQFGIWIVHTDKYQGKNLVYALSTVCTHLGCTPSWLDGEQKYKCPCHGSGFYINGINFEGPAPRPLERVGLRLAEDGMLEVDKSLKFQEEMGQWADPASFVEIS